MIEKQCETCKKMLNEEENFYRRDKTRYNSKCKKCFNSYCIARWTKRKTEAVAYKGGKCSICEYSRYQGALEFHHTNPEEKDFDWKELRKRTWSAVLLELDKCILVCSNCHRELHDEQYQQSKLAPSVGFEPT